MDIIILGLLMMSRFTIYEIRKNIEVSFSFISSNSMGSIQASIKKLSQKGFITCHEFVENSVNKKLYEITAPGKAYFFENISTPMRYKEKNMELGKFFFLGFTDTAAQLQLLDAYIEELEKERKTLLTIQKGIGNKSFDDNYLKLLQKNGAADEILRPHNGKTANEMLLEIAHFQYGTLELSLAKIDFEITWFKDFKGNLMKKGSDS
ncbi:MAG: PadR family transcriptional regulator [Lachnospiraceae bacterium]|nr:PadR family transcriptional regulator [Lachnospiraceae bacterium]